MLPPGAVPGAWAGPLGGRLAHCPGRLAALILSRFRAA